MRPSTIDDRPWCIDLSAAAQERAGLGRYAASLAEAMLAQGAALSAFVSDPSDSRLRPPLSELPMRTVGWSRPRWRLEAGMSYAGSPSIDRALQGVRLFHATDHLLPRLSRAASVFTLHDTAYLGPSAGRYHLARNRWFLRTMMPRFLNRADRIITPSEHTRRDALRHYRLDPAKIEVIPEGVDDRFHPGLPAETVSAIRERYRLPDRFVLCVGTIEPRKNLTTLLDAYAELRRDHPDVGLVLAGGLGWMVDDVIARVRSLRLERDVRLTGYVPDDEVPAVMNAADAFAYPSEYEGFGLPPLEAMACGVPVICSDATSLPEVVGDGGIQVPPHDVGAWVRALRRVLEDEEVAAALRAKGPARAARFTWTEAASRTIEVYRSVTAGR
ncbi:MAG TPA: glycosyltransferase family 1 protein [Actinomycetota bacterium]